MIIAIDPGVTTGVAWQITRHHGGDMPFDATLFQSDEFDEHTFYRWIDQRAGDITHCQIEQFVINAATVRKTIVYDSLYLIGYLRYKAFQHNFPIGFTKPADVMRPFPDVALKRAGMFNKGKGHANDAARHLAHYLVSTRRMSGSVFLPDALPQG